jgi:hypothetical protein
MSGWLGNDTDSVLSKTVDPMPMPSLVWRGSIRDVPIPKSHRDQYDLATGSCIDFFLKVLNDGTLLDSMVVGAYGDHPH